jgi:hypothetical protein
MILNNISDKQKVQWLQALAILGFLAAAFYAPKLWITTKEFPVIPLFDWIWIPKSPLDKYISWLFLGLLGVQTFFRNRLLGISTILLYVYLSFVDQNRLQPYFYQSILTLLAINIFPKKTEPKLILQAVALIFFATYFWSGIHKINEIFYTQWMHALTKHFSFVPEVLLKIFTYMVPHLEWIMGVCLLFNKLRKFAIIAIVIMHSIIVVVLFYLGYGFNVVPWNLQNILSVLVLFWSLKTVNFHEIFTWKLSLQKSLIMIFTILLPFSNIFGYWDHLLSYSFFTSKLKYYYIQIDDKELEKALPDHIKEYYRPHEGKVIIYPNEWAGDVNRVLFYPQERVINYLNEYLKNYSDKEDKNNLTTLVVYNQ